ncbi:MAG: carbon monoxide dehydrogenase subunit G [Rhizobiaceae bacterium]
MELSGEYEIAAPRTRVWTLLNDPAVLKECIPGCEELTADGDDAFAATVVLKIGPIKARFTGEVTLSDKIVPESYKITGEGKGGVVGFAKGSADVHLADNGGSTSLTYNVKADVGGKIAQLGSRLIASTSKKLADQFFGKFAQIAGAPVA